MAKMNVVFLFLFGAILAATQVQCKTIINEHGEMIADTEDDQETQNMDEVPDVNQDSEEDKRTYRQPIYRHPYFYPRRRSCGTDSYYRGSEVCCCGKKYTIKWRRFGYKRVQWKCCGYRYIDGYNNKCCPYFTVVSSKSKCPRSKV